MTPRLRPRPACNPLAVRWPFDHVGACCFAASPCQLLGLPVGLHPALRPGWEPRLRDHRLVQNATRVNARMPPKRSPTFAAPIDHRCGGLGRRPVCLGQYESMGGEGRRSSAGSSTKWNDGSTVCCVAGSVRAKRTSSESKSRNANASGSAVSHIPPTPRYGLNELANDTPQRFGDRARPAGESLGRRRY
ncbi:hypothetical protein Rcae01_01171 [Novipirellula caenicola]|uniref:Uncharacterized protein n=1 Tax=Novipirellula caenicola TaxID=1536901 RepID=A0ABP9VKK5_9BACT